MKYNLAHAVAIVALGIVPVAASAETVGIGDDTVKMFTSQAAGPVPVEATRDPSDTRGFGLDRLFGRNPDVLEERAAEREQRLIENGPTYR